MANTISNNRISNLVSSQLPFFVRNDHPNFITFLEKYYEYLEQNDKVINRIKNLQRYQDVDLTEDQFAERLYSTFLKYIPKDVLADKKILIKHIKDFYRTKGTEKATRFLLRALYDLEIDFYYPKKDILRASDGKWFIQKSLRITDTKIANVSNGNLTGLEKYIGTRIRGNTSNSTALVERIDRFFEQGTQIDELIISNVNGDFVNGELIYTIADESYISSNIFGGIINTIEITNGGSLYSVGDPVIIVSNTGVGACATISSVTTGNIASITVFSGGAGFRVNDFLLFSGGGGAGANANVKTVLSDNSIHPNTYNIVSTIIALEANTPLNNAVYSNLSSSNVNTSISNAVNFWTYSNTGPVQTVLILTPGSNYSSKPDISVIANSVIQQLGILGRMDIIDGGQNYTIGDIIEFINVPGGYGTGAYANVTNVDNSKSNAINEVKFQLVPGHFIGGSGYDINYLPTANVISNTGNGANIVVSATLGTGANLVPTTSTIGSIQRIVISNRGSNYDSNTTIDLTQSGDGNAKANVTTISGTFSYPGRYLNDDGHISSYNFLQDRDYYQIFSYVIRSDQSISKYRQAVKDIIHPAGMKLFGQYEYLNENVEMEMSPSANDAIVGYAYEPAYTLNFVDTINSIDSNVVFTRTSSGTYVNSSGYIATASANVARFTHNPSSLTREGVMFEGDSTNLLTYSQEFGNTTWSKSNVSVSSNAVMAPDGTMTGDILYESNTGFHILSKIVSGLTPNASMSLSVFAKKVSNRDIIRLSMQTGSNGAVLYCNLSNGYATNAKFGLGEVRLTPIVQKYSDGWYKLGFSGITSNTATSVFAQILTVKQLGTESYVAEPNQGYAIWGAQLERRDSPTSYIPTGSATVTRTADTATVNLSNVGVSTANGFTLQSEAKYYDLVGTGTLQTSTISLRNTSDSPPQYIFTRLLKRIGPTTFGLDAFSWNGANTEIDTFNIINGFGEKVKSIISYQNNDVIVVMSNGNNIIKSTDSSISLGGLTRLRINMEAVSSNGDMTIQNIKLYDKPLSNSAIYQLIRNP